LRDQFPQAEIHEADCLEQPLMEFLKNKLLQGEKAKVIANIPYHITTELLKRIVESREYLSEAIIMVQKEVAQKLYKPKPAERSFSQALIRSYASIELLFEVKRECFFPKPNVDSAIIRIRFTQKKVVPERFPEFLGSLFQQKKKQIFPLLSQLYTKEDALLALEHFKIDKRARPISLDETLLLDLFYFLEKIPLK
jgi:16S rRNA (adenine1518-N6/adenine1519-N6)-dimethyltransferase